MVQDQVKTTEQQCRMAGGERLAILFFSSRKGFEPRQSHYEVVRFKNGERLSANPSKSYGARDRTTFFVEGDGTEADKGRAVVAAREWIWRLYQKSDFEKNAFGDYVERAVEFTVPTK